ncbi:MAG TPA: phage tail protein [Chloroflexia bacterium]|jgi:phage tail-like protein
MAVREERPYVQFNFTVDLNVPGMDPGSFSGGFQEVSGIGMEVTVAEYRNGSDKDNGVRKITGLNKQADVTLKRGVIGATLLFDWLNEIRNGNQTSFRDVTVVMQNESHEPVLEWRLLRARVTKVTYGPLNAKGNDVAMEELVLAYERLEMRAR